MSEMKTTPGHREILHSDPATIVDRLREIYRIPITDSLGAVGSGEEPDNPDAFVRRFETSPIMHEAADEIEQLRSALGRANDNASAPLMLEALRAMDRALTERFNAPGSYDAGQELWGGAREAWIQIRCALSQAKAE